jgi:hypothetical protein
MEVLTWDCAIGTHLILLHPVDVPHGCTNSGHKPLQARTMENSKKEDDLEHVSGAEEIH